MISDEYPGVRHVNTIVTWALSDTATSIRPRQNRRLALLEVLLAFAVVHVAWRSFKHFTWLGRVEGAAHLNYSAGAFMILFSVLAVRLRSWRLSDFGVNLKDWRYNLNLGILWGVLEVAALLAVVRLLGFHPSNYVNPGTPWPLALIGSGIAIVYALVLLRMLRKPRASLAAVPAAVSIPILVILWSLPVLAAIYRHQPAAPMIGSVGWTVIGAGLGEEMFFRGYIQTRLDLAFGKPVAMSEIRFGMGLIVSSLLFGLVHALNTVDYFNGHFRFNWSSGFFNCFTGLVYAVMREKTGSIFPGAIAHGISDVATRIPG
jgi:membrane protease YdiL (CAAX protease family)